MEMKMKHCNPAQWMHRESATLTFKQHVYWNKILLLAVKKQNKIKTLYMYFPRVEEEEEYTFEQVCDGVDMKL